jgi:hypothetical protein
VQCNYNQLGRLFVAQRPYEALQFILTRFAPPKESDFSKVKEYYKKFLGIHPPPDSEDSRKKAYQRALFTAAMLHIYQPAIFFSKKIHLKPGLGKAIREEFGTSKPHMSMLIRQVVVRERVYGDFKEKVNHVLTALS